MGWRGSPVIHGKWRTLLLATAMFNLEFVIWFSFTPFTGGIAEEFGLSVAELGVVASAAIVAVPLGRILIGPLTDRYGAPVTAGATLVTVGIFSIVSAYARSYEVFMVSRVIASLAGITFVIGIQHVAEWFEEENLGLAEGIFAGVGNAGAGLGAYFTLPLIFDADPLFTTNWRAAFFYTGVLAIALGIVYYAFGEAAKSDEKRRATRESTSLGRFLYIGTRYGTVVLSVAYVMTFGLELAMNGWLGTYYREAFGRGDIVIAATFAATFSIVAGLLRPIGGYVSDVAARREPRDTPLVRGPLQGTGDVRNACLRHARHVRNDRGRPDRQHLRRRRRRILRRSRLCVRRGGDLRTGPRDVPRQFGKLAGIVGGIGAVGGVVYPPAFSTTLLPNLHPGYAVAGATMVPILVLCARVFQPAVAERATTGGWIVDEPAAAGGSVASNDD